MTKQLVEAEHDFPILEQSKLLHSYRGEERNAIKRLFLRKNVYPYSFASSLSRLQSCKHIPERALFKNSLTGEDISEEDWFHAKSVFEKLRCSDMLQYTGKIF